MASRVFSHLSSWKRRTTLALQMDALMGSSGAPQHPTMREISSIPSVQKNLVRLWNRDVVFTLIMTVTLLRYCVDFCQLLLSKLELGSNYINFCENCSRCGDTRWELQRCPLPLPIPLQRSQLHRLYHRWPPWWHEMVRYHLQLWRGPAFWILPHGWLVWSVQMFCRISNKFTVLSKKIQNNFI